jgi:hypothetical protein
MELESALAAARNRRAEPLLPLPGSGEFVSIIKVPVSSGKGAYRSYPQTPREVLFYQNSCPARKSQNSININFCRGYFLEEGKK